MSIDISDVLRRVVYAPNGVGPYQFTFEVLTQTDIDVYRGSTLLTLTTDYTVSLNIDGTGSVTLVSTAGTSNITIVGARGIARSTDFVTGGDLLANSLNDELDAQTIFSQQTYELALRGLKAPVYDPTDVNMTLPTKAERLGKVLSFDSVTGNPITVEEIGEWRGNWAATTYYAKRDLVKDSSNSNVYRCNTAHTSSGTTPISSNADSAKWDLVVDAAAAGASASAAASSASAAASSASAAATSASNASTSASNASTSATNAANSASTASTQASNASTSATNAASSATTASTQATNAANSATAAATSATNASNSATAAATSATSASNSASTATTQASNASTSATNAATSETNAATSATAAAASLAAMDDAEIVMTIDGGGLVILAGKKGAIEIPFNCTIDRWTITADQSGSITIDINKSTYSGYPTTTSITGSAIPAISSAQKAQSSTLTGWTTTLSSGDILEFEVDATPTSITLATISLKVTKT